MLRRYALFLTCSFLLVFPGVPSCQAEGRQVSPSANTKTSPPASFDPTDRYVLRTVEGWQVRVHPDLLAKDSQVGAQALRELEVQLYQIKRQLPPEAVAKLQQVRIWLERNEPHHPCATYHPNRDWLVAHGMNPDKYRCVEISNAATFVEWTRDLPWMVLHELSHAYHDQFVPGGFQNPEVLQCYKDAVQSGLYNAVLHVRKKEKVRAYALNNQMEYFAEETVALFGCNSFYPFNRRELEDHDPALYKTLLKLWGVSPPKTQ